MSIPKFNSVLHTGVTLTLVESGKTYSKSTELAPESVTSIRKLFILSFGRRLISTSKEPLLANPFPLGEMTSAVISVGTFSSAKKLDG